MSFFGGVERRLAASCFDDHEGWAGRVHDRLQVRRAVTMRSTRIRSHKERLRFGYRAGVLYSSDCFEVKRTPEWAYVPEASTHTSTSPIFMCVQLVPMEVRVAARSASAVHVWGRARIAGSARITHSSICSEKLFTVLTVKQRIRKVTQAAFERRKCPSGMKHLTLQSNCRNAGQGVSYTSCLLNRRKSRLSNRRKTTHNGIKQRLTSI